MSADRSAHCPECGNPVEWSIEDSTNLCSKCGTKIRPELRNELFFVDIAHNGEDWERAKEKILWGIDRTLSGHFKGVKVVHGRGAGNGHTKVIMEKAVPFLRECEGRFKGKLVKDKRNDGAHILYFN